MGKSIYIGQIVQPGVQKWVAATREYNTRLEALNKTRNCPTIKKNPKVLLDLLGEIEVKFSDRIIKNNFVCESVC